MSIQEWKENNSMKYRYFFDIVTEHCKNMIELCENEMMKLRVLAKKKTDIVFY